MDWSQTYPGIPSMVPAIRAFVMGLLDESPRRDDARVIASELTTNSLRHTPSGDAGGEITVAVSTGDGWARIAVTDQGAGGWGRPVAHAGEDEETGRGLEIVAALADKIGHDVDEHGQTVWAELTWS
jgi:anti-sigma regulatory factor (Ser/Thr protein kinase)